MAFPTSIELASYFGIAYNNLSTTLSSEASASDTTIYVASTDNFDTIGEAICEDEIIYHTGKTAGSFTGCTRGYGNTTAAVHTAGRQVSLTFTATMWERIVAEVRATQTALGITGAFNFVDTTNAQTVAGVKTLSDTPKMDAIAEKTAATGVTVDGILLKDSLDVSGITPISGWIAAGETWTRTGNFTFTVTGDVTTKYPKSTKVRYKDGGAYEYGYVISATYGAPNTTITLATNTDYAMAAVAITDNYYSYTETPQGFPDWFNVTAPTFDVTTYDDGVAGQPTTTKNRMKITGKQCTVNYLGSGVKAGLGISIVFNPSVYPASGVATANTLIGMGLIGVTAWNAIMARWDSASAINVISTASIADNTAVTVFALTLNYEI